MSTPPVSPEDGSHAAGAAAAGPAMSGLSVDALIERFGGIRPMAAKLDVPVTTVQGWKERAAIPERRWPEIVAAARLHGIRLTPESRTAAIEPPPQPGNERSQSAATPPSADPDDDPPQRRRSRRRYWIGGSLAVVAAVLLFSGAGVKERWNSFLSRHAATPEQVNASGSSETAVEPKAETPSQPSPSTTESGAPDAALADRIATLEARLAASDNTVVTALKSENRRLNEEANELRARLSVMEQDRASRWAERERAQALFMALGQLRAALAGAAPYAAQLELIETAVGHDSKMAATLATLRPYADRGAPTRPMLDQHFPAIAGDVMNAMPSTGGAWRERIGQQIASLVVVRRIGSNAPDGGAEAILARTEHALSAGDLATAVATMERLSGPHLDAAGPWLADARARLAADRALLALEARTYSLLIGSDGAKAP